MKGMKRMKSMKSKVMKSMKRMKAMKRVSKIAKGPRARAAVFLALGPKTKTASGLEKKDMMRNKAGKIVTKKSHAAGRRAYANIKGWVTAVSKARKELKIKGFKAVKKGTPLYKRAKEIYGQ